ncbi:hypothetical protein IP88_14755 [alpha proteobacterium AAP81b]|nr:hypothetical protein IP88_14755 [alpha proteobacterium AAP81b]
MSPLRYALPLTLLAVAGCAPTFEARVARFQALPPQAGQSFTVEPRDGEKAGLEFETYANLVRQRLVANGFREAAGASPDLVVQLDYNVGPPREKVRTSPGYGGFGYGGYGGFGYGGYGRFGGFGGWNPYWGGFGPGAFGGFGFGPEIYSVTQYNSQAAIRITRAADKQSVFEGRAETVSTSNNLTRLVPNLVTAIFTNFPGNSGETVRVTFDPAKPGVPATIRPVRG